MNALVAVLIFVGVASAGDLGFHGLGDYGYGHGLSLGHGLHHGGLDYDDSSYGHHGGIHVFHRPIINHVKPVVVERPVVVEKKVFVQKPVYVNKPVYIPRPVYVQKPVLIEKPVAVHVQRPVIFESHGSYGGGLGGGYGGDDGGYGGDAGGDEGWDGYKKK